MEPVETLLARATVMCGTKRELARRIGISEQNLQGVIKGRQFLTPKQTIGLANMLDVSPLELLAQVTVAREKDPVERGRLMEGFLRRGTLGAVVMCLAIGTATSDEVKAQAIDYGSDGLVKVDNLYIVAHLWRQVKRWIAARQRARNSRCAEGRFTSHAVQG